MNYTYTNNTKKDNCVLFTIYGDNKAMYTRNARTLNEAYAIAKTMVYQHSFKTAVIYGSRNKEKVYINTIKVINHRT